ncbi:MAG TPA: hypothetical protein VK607_00080 [Kofleriaceae bacterium]|nr:hypothetical protein [Kofleriaceae bacterium]HMG53127.1 hypothetical protein [Kofleriaceae bacterium]
MPLSRRFLIAGLISLWVALAVVGSLLLQRYEATPGRTAAAPARWPMASRLAAPRDRPVLVVFAHPECSCSRATLAELAEIASEAGAACDITVVVDDDVPDPSSSELVVRARAIPGVRIVIDRDHAEAARFGALTSGFTVLYRGDGRLAFAGGITDGRGQAGRSAGRAQITALLRGRHAAPATPVFGCELGQAPEPQR